MKKFLAILGVLMFAVLLVLFDYTHNYEQEATTSIVTTDTVTSEPTPNVTPEPTPEPARTPTTTVVNGQLVLVTMAPTATPVPEISGTMEIHQINVGCADAYLLKSGDTAIMVDGGLAESRNKVLTYLRNAGVSKLTAYIGTHWHGDHVGNMTAILDEFGTSETLVFGSSKNLSSSLSIPNGKGIYQQMADGDVFDFGGIHIKCMGPYKLSQSGECNYDSLNFLVTFGETKLFMTGDYVHKEVLESYKEELTNVDIYKMAHHGLKVSEFSGNPNVLPILNPDIILVPANSNSPATELFRKLGISADVYNNKSGNVVVTTDGMNTTVSTEK